MVVATVHAAVDATVGEAVGWRDLAATNGQSMMSETLRLPMVGQDRTAEGRSAGADRFTSTGAPARVLLRNDERHEIPLSARRRVQRHGAGVGRLDRRR